MIKIAFFDIDGTVLDFGSVRMNPPVLYALRELRKGGIRCFAATGRPPYFLSEEIMLHFDGALCFNGGLCYDKSGVISRNPMNKQDVLRVIANAASHKHPVTVTTDREYGSNGFDPLLEAYLGISEHTSQVTDRFDSFLEEDIYQMMIAAPKEEDAALLDGTRFVKSARWWDEGADIIPRDGGKAMGIAQVLRHYGLKREECIAFGDGGNDLDMIRYAGVGVAMGNAGEELKAEADYVTDSCADDGVYTALLHFGLIRAYRK